MSEKCRVRFTPETVIKTGDPLLLRVEVEKTRRAGEVAARSGLFRVPRVLDYDDDRGEAVFERLTGIEPLRSAVSWGREYAAVGARVGTLLAVVHKELRLPDDMVFPLPPEFAAPGQDVFLHGDPSVFNICLDRRSSSIVVLDWQMTRVHGGRSTYGCRYFDVLWFVNNLLWVPTLRHMIGDPVRPVARSFIEAYYREAAIPYDPEGFRSYAERFFAVKSPLRSRGGRRQRLFIPRCSALTQRFLRSLRKDIPHG